MLANIIIKVCINCVCTNFNSTNQCDNQKKYSLLSNKENDYNKNSLELLLIFISWFIYMFLYILQVLSLGIIFMFLYFAIVISLYNLQHVFIFFNFIKGSNINFKLIFKDMYISMLQVLYGHNNGHFFISQYIRYVNNMFSVVHEFSAKKSPYSLENYKIQELGPFSAIWMLPLKSQAFWHLEVKIIYFFLIITVYLQTLTFHIFISV